MWHLHHCFSVMWLFTGYRYLWNSLKQAWYITIRGVRGGKDLLKKFGRLPKPRRRVAASWTGKCNIAFIAFHARLFVIYAGQTACDELAIIGIDRDS
jgi:hypothetical protein